MKIGSNDKNALLLICITDWRDRWKQIGFALELTEKLDFDAPPGQCGFYLFVRLFLVCASCSLS
jgi:hypothetical protein